MKQLLITKCSNPLMWYRDLVGQVVPLVRDLHDERCWLSREPEGFANIIRKTDAVVLPFNYLPVPASEVIQHGDFVHIADGVWVHASLDQIRKPAEQLIAVRRKTSPYSHSTTSSRSHP
jgi:hypothetical protein